MVLTSSLTRQSRSGETVFDSDPAMIAVPALVVANQGDAFGATPPGDASLLLADMSRAPRKDLILVNSTEVTASGFRSRGLAAARRAA